MCVWGELGCSDWVENFMLFWGYIKQRLQNNKSLLFKQNLFNHQNIGELRKMDPLGNTNRALYRANKTIENGVCTFMRMGILPGFRRLLPGIIFALLFFMVFFLTLFLLFVHFFVIFFLNFFFGLFLPFYGLSWFFTWFFLIFDF